jgi:glycerate dehydrogenase
MSALDELGDITSYQTTDANETIDRIKDADIVITNKVIMDQDVISSATNLKLICVAATGVNNIDLNYASIKGVVVKNVAGYSTKSVVQHTFAMALYLIERLAYHDYTVKGGGWHTSGIFTDVTHPFFEISGKKWGIIGLGAIGQEVARIATAFGADVCHYSTTGKNIYQPYTHLDLDTLLQECDIISIHAPLNDNTKYLLNENNLHLIKEGAILLNLGRGGIINETDLAFELDRKEFYAGIDVLEIEPIELDNSLMHIKHPERLLITPHIAWTSIEAREKLFNGIIHNIEIFLEKYEERLQAEEEKREKLAQEIDEKIAKEARERAEEAIKEAMQKEVEQKITKEQTEVKEATTVESKEKKDEHGSGSISANVSTANEIDEPDIAKATTSVDNATETLEDRVTDTNNVNEKDDKPKKSIDDIIKKMIGKPLV